MIWTGGINPIAKSVLKLLYLSHDFTDFLPIVLVKVKNP